MHQLDGCAVCNLLTVLDAYPLLIVDCLLRDALLEHPVFLLSQQDLGRVLLLSLLLPLASLELLVQLPVLDGLAFPLLLSHGIVSKFGHDLKDHVSEVGHVRRMQL